MNRNQKWMKSRNDKNQRLGETLKVDKIKEKLILGFVTKFNFSKTSFFNSATFFRRFVDFDARHEKRQKR